MFWRDLFSTLFGATTETIFTFTCRHTGSIIHMAESVLKFVATKLLDKKCGQITCCIDLHNYVVCLEELGRNG
jgi:hypothetical protein